MPVVLLHGLGQSPASWDAVIQALKTEEVLCPDLFSPLRGGGASYPELYRAFAKYCGGLDGPLQLCGLSLGGILALQYAAEQPERVKSLVLIGTPCVMPKTLLKSQNLVFHFLPGRAFRQMGLSKKDVISLTRSMMDLDLRENLGKLRCPVLVFCGERDKANRRAALELKAELPKAELIWILGAGHEVNVDAPEKLAETLADFYRL